MRVFVLLSLLFSPLLCLGQSTANPAAPGFRADASDPQAIALADAVMEAQGGRQAWDQTRYLTWNFFGSRTHVWDRYTGRVRIESHRDSTLYLVNVLTGEGRAFKAGEEITEPEARAKAVERARSMWINDSYWLILPFKLKDSGVTLTYQGEHSTQQNNPAEVVQLTFEEVGVTPENRYWVYIDKDTHRVVQWDYYAKAEDTEPRMEVICQNYQRYGDIWLTGDHGKYTLSEIAVLESVPDAVFTEPNADW